MITFQHITIVFGWFQGKRITDMSFERQNAKDDTKDEEFIPSVVTHHVGVVVASRWLFLFVCNGESTKMASKDY